MYSVSDERGKMNTKILEEITRCYEAGDADSITRLNQLLIENEQERQQFLLDIIDEDLIADELKISQIESLYQDSSNIEPLNFEKKLNSSWVYSVLAIAAVVVAFIVINLDFSSDSEVIAEEKSQAEDPVVQLVASTPDADWGETLSEDKVLEMKSYQLLSGSAHIEFSNGVQLSMEAPVHIEIKDAFNVYVGQGKVRAHVPESGYGFKIQTPDIKIKDLGTEFGVAVEEGMETAVHVFNGEIELYSNAEDTPLLAHEGYSAKWVDGKPEDNLLAKEADFPTLKSIASKRWNNFQRNQLLDPSLLLHLDFKGGSEKIGSAAKNNFTATTESHLKVRGRWGRDSAYVLDSMDQSIRLPDMKIEGDFTIQAWIHPDVFESSISVIMNTERHRDDRFHWQIERTGSVKVGYKGSKIKTKHGQAQVQIGQWNHVAITFDSEKKLLKSYVNGELAYDFKRWKSYLNLTNTYIGGWRPNQRLQYEPRLLNGKIDEFSIHGRALKSGEILKAFEVGLP